MTTAHRGCRIKVGHGRRKEVYRQTLSPPSVGRWRFFQQAPPDEILLSGFSVTTLTCSLNFISVSYML